MGIKDFFKRKEQPQPAPSDNAEYRRMASEMAWERQKLAREKQRADTQLEMARIQDELDELREEKELKRTERIARIQALMGGGEKAGSIQDQMLMSLFNRAIPPKGSPSGTPSQNHHTGGVVDLYKLGTGAPAVVASPPPQQQQQIVARTISDQEIADVWNQIPAPYRAAAKNMSDDDLRSEIINEYPEADPESIGRAIAFVRRS